GCTEPPPSAPTAYGAYPDFEFAHQERERKAREKRFQAPSLSLPEGVGTGRLADRVALLRAIDRQRADLDRLTSVEPLDRYRQAALSLLTDGRVRRALDVTNAAPGGPERYGRNS